MTLRFIAEHSEANNRDIQGSESQLAFICIYIYVCISVCHAPRGPGASHEFKMASHAVSQMPSSNSWCRNRQRSGQVYYTVLSSKAYYSS